MKLIFILSLVVLAVAKPASELDYIDDILLQLEELLAKDESKDVRDVVDAYNRAAAPKDKGHLEVNKLDDNDDDLTFTTPEVTEVDDDKTKEDDTSKTNDDDSSDEADDDTEEDKNDFITSPAVEVTDDGKNDVTEPTTDAIAVVEEETFSSLAEAIKAKYGEQLGGTRFKYLYGELLADVVKEAVVAMLDEQADDIKELIAVRAARAMLETVKDKTFSLLRHVIRQKAMAALMLSGALPHQDQLPQDFEPLVNAIFSHLTVDTEAALEQISEIFYDDQYENIFTTLAKLEKDASFFNLPCSEALEILKKTLSSSLGQYPSDGLLPPGILIESIANTVNFLARRLSSMDEMELPDLDFSANGPRVALIMTSLRDDLQGEVSEAVGFLHALEAALRAGEDGVVNFFSAVIARETERIIKLQEASMSAIISLNREAPQLIAGVDDAIENGHGQHIFKKVLITVAQQLHESGLTHQEIVSALTGLLAASLSS